MESEAVRINPKDTFDERRITRWLVLLDPSFVDVDGERIVSSLDDRGEDGAYISNFKWCVRTAHALLAKGVNAYTKRAGRFCAVFARLTRGEKKALSDMTLDETEIERIAAAEAAELESVLI